jgi:hypothetical protein
LFRPVIIQKLTLGPKKLAGCIEPISAMAWNGWMAEQLAFE